ncbi:MAG: ABC transporter substrate-binding protein [Acidimicrobiales bacterium]|jgi:branched-chain amino acid transport system substrate-binding protein
MSTGALAVLTTLPLVVLGATLSTATGASASPAPITIAYISSLTGTAASQDGSSPAGFEARIALQNAFGGVNGHMLVPLVIDDQTNPSLVVTAVQSADSKAFGIVSQSPIMYFAAKYAQEAGVPVTGSYDDGPEWGEKPNTNMFASDEGSLNPKYPVNTLLGDFIKQHGGTNLGAYGYSISPSSSRAAIQTADAFKHAGGKVGVLDTTVPFGGVNFTSTALVAKQKGINAMVPALDNDSNYALATALKQAGVKLKAVLFATGYEPSVIHSTVWNTVQGDYFLSLFRPFSLPNTATKQMAAALQKYEHFSKSQFPTFSQYESWAGADLMIKGLEMAGPNPTRAAVIKDLRGLKSYDANGLLPKPINYSTIFGHDTPDCTWIMKAETNGFTPVSTQPICGSDIPGTSTASPSS